MQSSQSRQCLSLAQRRVAPARNQLLSLGEKFDLSNTAAP